MSARLMVLENCAIRLEPSVRMRARHPGTFGIRLSLRQGHRDPESPSYKVTFLGQDLSPPRLCSWALSGTADPLITRPGTPQCTKRALSWRRPLPPQAGLPWVGQSGWYCLLSATK